MTPESNEWGFFQYAVVVLSALWAVVLTLGSVIGTLFNSRVSRSEREIGIQFSKINDLRVDLTEAETRIANHSDKFQEIIAANIRIESKLDALIQRK